jgi:hypothetical protein
MKFIKPFSLFEPVMVMMALAAKIVEHYTDEGLVMA